MLENIIADLESKTRVMSKWKAQPARGEKPHMTCSHESTMHTLSRRRSKTLFIDVPSFYIFRNFYHSGKSASTSVVMWIAFFLLKRVIKRRRRTRKWKVRGMIMGMLLRLTNKDSNSSNDTQFSWKFGIIWVDHPVNLSSGKHIAKALVLMSTWTYLCVSLSNSLLNLRIYSWGTGSFESTRRLKMWRAKSEAPDRHFQCSLIKLAVTILSKK